MRILNTKNWEKEQHADLKKKESINSLQMSQEIHGLPLKQYMSSKKYHDEKFDHQTTASQYGEELKSQNWKRCND